MIPFPVSHWSSGLGSPSFFAPLTNTVVPTTATGSATASFSVSGAIGSVVDWDGIVRRVKTGEARFMGARRVENLLAGSSENLTNGSWASSSAGAGSAAPTLTANFATDPLGGSTASRFQATLGSDPAAGISHRFQTVTRPYSGVRAYRWSVWLKSNSGTPTIAIRLSATSGTLGIFNVTLTSSWVRYTTNVASSASGDTNVFPGIGVYGTNFGGSGNTATAVDVLVWGAQLEEVSGQSDQDPGEYVSVGVTSTPYHGAVVDGVKYYATKNGNSVASNIITEAVGAAITSASGGSTLATDATGPYGFVSEYGATNSMFAGSEHLSAWGTLDGMTSPAANGVAGPAGYATNNAIVEDGASSIHGPSNAVTLAATQNLCIGSIFIKPGTTRESINIRFHDGTHGLILQLRSLTTTPVIFSYTEIGTQFVLGNSGLITYPNGWYRAWFAFTKNASTAFTWQSWPINVNGGSNTYTGTNGHVAMYLWGAYVTQGAPAEYVPNWAPDGGGGRGGEALSYVFASNASATVGTVYAEAKTYWSAGMSYSAPVVCFGAVASSLLTLYNANEASTIIRTNDGTNNVQKTGLSDMNTAPRKLAASWTGTTLRVTGSGAAAATGTFDGNMGSTGIAVGDGTTFTGNVWTGSVRNLKSWAGKAGTSAQLVTLTT